MRLAAIGRGVIDQRERVTPMHNRRLYCLQEKRSGRWMRISRYAYYKPQAVRAFQTALLAPFLGTCENSRRLSPTKLIFDPTVTE